MLEPLRQIGYTSPPVHICMYMFLEEPILESNLQGPSVDYNCSGSAGVPEQQFRQLVLAAAEDHLQRTASLHANLYSYVCMSPYSRIYPQGQSLRLWSFCRVFVCVGVPVSACDLVLAVCVCVFVCVCVGPVSL